MTILAYNLETGTEVTWMDATTPLDRVLGIDVSRWQDDNSTPQQMDFEKAYAEGARFVFIKASQGTWADEDILYNWKSAKDAGLWRGAYHYLDNSANGTDQADFFCGVIRNDPGELPPVIDYEYRTDPPGIENLIYFVDRVETNFNLKPIIYTSPWYWKEYGSTYAGVVEYPLWIANYEVIEPAVPAPWTDWTFWQYTSKGDGLKYGAESYHIDLNWYNGSWSDFVEQFGGEEPPTEKTYQDGRDDMKAEIVAALEDMR